MDVYVASLTLLIILLLAAGYWKANQDGKDISLVKDLNEQEIELLDDEIHDIDRETTADRYHDFRLQFLTVYGLAIAADWLQVCCEPGKRCLNWTCKLTFAGFFHV